MSGLVISWMGDRLGIPDAVKIYILYSSILNNITFVCMDVLVALHAECIALFLSF